MSTEKVKLAADLGCPPSFNNSLALLLHKYKDVVRCDRIYQDISCILSFISQPELEKLRSLLLDKDSGEDLEKLIQQIERRKKELEIEKCLASVEEYVRSSFTSDSEETFEEREVRNILEKYGEREGERRRLYRRFSDDVRELNRVTDVLRGEHQVETINIPDLDGDFNQLSRLLTGVKPSMEEFLLVKSSKWVLQEYKGNLELIDSVRRKANLPDVKQVGQYIYQQEDKSQDKVVTEERVSTSLASVELAAHSTPRQSSAEAGHYSEAEVRLVIREFIPDRDKQISFENFLKVISDGSGRVSKKIFDVILEESPRLFADS